MKWSNALLIPSSVLLLGACTLGPDYEKPETHLETPWAESFEEKVSQEAIEQKWWERFEDPILEGYILQAMQENRDLRAAEARIQQARALRRETKADFYPTLDAEGGHTRQRNSASTTGEDSSRTSSSYQAGLNASWEIDIFGGTRRAGEASDARLQMTVEEKRAVRLLVLAEVARNYYDVRGVQKRMEITKQNIALQNQTFQLVNQLLQLGEASEFDLVRARGQLQATQSQLPELDAELKAGIYRLSVLLGQVPSTLLAEMTAAKPLPAPPELVPVGQLSDILRRRPDIRTAERELAAATADVGVATADLFPRFVLLGSIGRTSNSLDGLRDSPNNRFGFSQFVQWPLFQGGQIRAQIQAEEAEVDEALALYEQTILEALADVEISLIQYLRELDKKLILQQARKSRQRSVELAQARFNLGEEDFLSVLDAERELTEAEDDLVDSEIQSMLRLITLYTALGGGWEAFEGE
ncbi:efflux transporter outer membrane subunit [Kiritimatiellaeota bacterium B1221]|nr:efflux transporter outer membrane subunit [Kiritimatiellaeota bacterium B1221]